VIPLRFAAVAFAAVGLSSCAVVPHTRPAAPAPVASRPPVAAPSGNALTAGVRPGPPVRELGLTQEGARAALAAFRISCPSLVKRADSSRLTVNGDWVAPCDAARSWADGDAIGFFTAQFDAVVVGEGKAFATGYYEPEIAGSRTPAPGYQVPVYRRPADLVEADLGLFSPDWKGKKIRGRIEAAKLMPYPDRAAIDDGALRGQGLEIGWAADPIEFFFLQVQGCRTGR